MGEIYLATDPSCNRTVALKKIREKLLKYQSIRDRFIREANVAANLTHPSIIPIYEINKDDLYYTMPYIEGETLKAVLKEAKQHPIGTSIQALAGIFLKVCEAVAYTHSKGFLHRDLKPENIMVGKFGEVLILDWGLAMPIGSQETEEEELPEELGLTKPGKVVGTTNYMAPERARGETSTISTDIYSLGVILYQILTLKLPFKRPTLKEFQKIVDKEQYIEPQEVAPYRDIPDKLAALAQKCLDPSPHRRYQSVDALITDLREYTEGSPNWLETARLDIAKPADWEFQENVCLAKHMALTKHPEVMEWVMLMISKEGFTGNMRIDCSAQLKEGSDGIGFLLSIPEAVDRKGIEDGYCLWLDATDGIILYRNNVEVERRNDITFKKGEVAIEKVEGTLRLYIDGTFVMSFSSYLPLVGTHVGLIARDAHFSLGELKISVGSQRVMVNCLSIPDALFASKNFNHALTEYRRIAHSFQGRPEGREARFRAGHCLLEQARWEDDPHLVWDAFEEFEKLQKTPLEYLGKSLVYAFEGDAVEEAKCLELAFRKYAKHPMRDVLEHHLALRLHEATKESRLAGYHLALLALLHAPRLITPDLRTSLITSLEPLPFLNSPQMATTLAFFLGKPHAFVDLKDDTNVPSCLYALGYDEKPHPFATGYLDILKGLLPKEDLPHIDDHIAGSDEEKRALSILRLWASLLRGEPGDALLDQIERPPHFLVGCNLILKGLPYRDHFENHPGIKFPSSEHLLATHLTGHLDRDNLLWWERLTLHRQLALYYHCLGRRRKCAHAIKQVRHLQESQKIPLSIY